MVRLIKDHYENMTEWGHEQFGRIIGLHHEDPVAQAALPCISFAGGKPHVDQDGIITGDIIEDMTRDEVLAFLNEIKLSGKNVHLPTLDSVIAWTEKQ